MEKPTGQKLPETIADKSSIVATRRELFHIGNMLALPVLMSAFEAEAAPAPGPLKTGPGMEIYQSIGVEPVSLRPGVAIDRLSPATQDGAIALARAEHPTVAAAQYTVDAAQ